MKQFAPKVKIPAPPSRRVEQSAAIESPCANHAMAAAQQGLQALADDSPIQAERRRLAGVIQGREGFGSVAAGNAIGVAAGGSGATLPDRLRAGLERLSGLDLATVRVHYNSPMPAQLQARAYAQGKEIHLGPGQERHLPHEAWHTVQQTQGRVRPTRRVAGITINDDRGLEHEADSMGARALLAGRGELGGAPSRAAATSARGAVQGAGVIQGMFGFELETSILLTSRHHDAAGAGYFGKPIALSYPRVGTTQHYHVHVDHSSRLNAIATDQEKGSGNAPIVELVTIPIDEFAVGPTRVRNVMRSMAAFINNAKQKTRSFTRRTRANKVVAGLPAHLRLGTGAGGAAAAQGTMVYPQATYAIDLANITTAFEAHADTGIADQQSTAMTKATGVATRVGNKVWDRYRDRKRDFGKGPAGSNRWFENPFQIGQRTGLAGFEGLVALIANYLIMGKEQRNARQLAKNQIGLFFYKSSLSSVQRSLSGEVRALLQHRHGKIADWVIAECARRPDDLVVPCPHLPTCRDWVREVLAGTNDSMFSRMRNQYAGQSGELAPEPVGPTGGGRNLGVVMENRRLWDSAQQKAKGLLAELKRGGNRNPGPDELVDLGLRVYRALRVLNAANPRADDARDAITGG